MKSKCFLPIVAVCAVFALLAFASCGKGDSPSPSPTPNPPDPPVVAESLEFAGQYSSGRADVSSDAASFVVEFNSSGSWAVNVPAACAAWCKVSPASGDGGKKSEVRVSVSGNDGYDERNASLTFSCGKARKTFVVAQKQRDAMLLASSSKVEVDEDGGTFAVKIRSNVEVKCEVPAQYAGWLRLNGKAGGRALSDLQYSFTADANDTAAPREGVITFSGADVVEEVRVLQFGGNSLVLTEPVVYVNPLGGRFGVELKSNCDYTFAITEGSEWLREDVSRAMSSHTVYFIADANSQPSERRAAVTFTSADGSVSDRLTVVQREKGALVCGERQIDVDCAGGAFHIEYASTEGEITYSSPYWIGVFPDAPDSRAMADHRLQIKVSPNIVKEERSGYVVLALADGSAKDSVLVTQDALEYTIVTSLEDGDFADARSHEFTISVTSPLESTLKASAPLKKMSDNTFVMPANYAPGTMGSASVEVRIADVLMEMVSVSYDEPILPEIKDRELDVAAVASSVKVNIMTNTDIAPSIQSSASWISLREAKVCERGYAIDTWVFDVKENTSDQPRQATIRFSAGAFWSGDVVVTQAGAAPPIDKEQEVEVPAGGSLGDELGDEKMAIQKLTVKGEINGADVATLREMATDGELVEIDLSNTSLRKDLQHQYYPGGWRPGKITDDDMVGHYMFYRTNVRAVTLPGTLKKIGYYAFRESKVEEMEIPAGVAEIEESAFFGCKNLRRVSVPGTVKDLPLGCFEGAVSLSDVALGDGVRSIGDFAFAPYEAYTTQGALTEISLPASLEKIGKGAFLSTKLTEVTVPASVERIGEAAFSECRRLNRVVFECSMDTLPARVLHNTLGINEIVFPRGLKVIGEYALDHVGMDYLTIPDGVTELMKGACNGSGKKGLTLPESLEVIGAYALGYQSMSSTFTIPSKVRYIGARAFDGACYIKELHMKNPVPPQRDGDIFFSTFKYEECTLYVPRGSARAYSADSYWLKFKAIVEE